MLNERGRYEKRMSNLLASVPIGAGPAQTAIWHSLQPLTFDLFNTYWQLCQPDLPMMDWDDTLYEELEDEGGWTFLGMRHKVTGR